MIKNLAIGGGSNRALLLVALVLGLVSAVLVGVFLSQTDGNGGGSFSGATVPVVVAAQDIAAGTPITAEMVSVKPVPNDVALSSAFQKAEDVVGKVTRVPIISGEQVVAGRLVGAGEAGQILAANSLAEVVPLQKPAVACSTDRCGQRAVSVAVASVTSSGGQIRPGDRVDVVLALQDGSAVTILQDIEVLSIDQDFGKVVSGAAGEGAEGERAVVSTGEENSEATTATLAVWPDEAQKLTAGEEFTKGVQFKIVSDALKTFLGLPLGKDYDTDCKGSVRLVLRHAGQQGPVDLETRGTCASIFTYIWAPR